MSVFLYQLIFVSQNHTVHYLWLWKALPSQYKGRCGRHLLIFQTESLVLSIANFQKAWGMNYMPQNKIESTQFPFSEHRWRLSRKTDFFFPILPTTFLDRIKEKKQTQQWLSPEAFQDWGQAHSLAQRFPRASAIKDCSRKLQCNKLKPWQIPEAILLAELAV